MSANDYGVNDLISNPTPRVPICLCLDVSGSMRGSPITELNKGVRIFFDSLNNHEIARYSADVCVVTFGGDAQCINDFESLDKQNIPTFYASGGTPMVEALDISLNKLDTRKKQYQEYGVDYYQPWLVVMTDGYPDNNTLLPSISDRASNMQKNKKLSIFPIAIGNSANEEILKKISPLRTPMKLKGLNFVEFFEWLSRSVITVSQSQPGEGIKLDVDGIAGWAEL